MRKYVNAVSVTEVSERCANIGYGLRPMGILHLSVGVVLSVLSVALGFVDMMTASFYFYALPGATIVIAGLGAAFYRTRSIGGEVLGAYLYASISDELRSRGIRNTKRYLLDHPAHVAICNNLGEALGTTFTKENRRKIQSFIFMTDGDPEKTSTAILTIIGERKVSDPAAIKGILSEFEKTSTPLTSGAL